LRCAIGSLRFFITGPVAGRLLAVQGDASRLTLSFQSAPFSALDTFERPADRNYDAP
jgi:hypothetical protein